MGLEIVFRLFKLKVSTSIIENYLLITEKIHWQNLINFKSTNYLNLIFYGKYLICKDKANTIFYLLKIVLMFNKIIILPIIYYKLIKKLF